MRLHARTHTHTHTDGRALWQTKAVRADESSGRAAGGAWENNLSAALRRDGKAGFVGAVLHHVLDTGLRLGHGHLEMTILAMHALAILQRVFALAVYYLQRCSGAQQMSPQI